MRPEPWAFVKVYDPRLLMSIFAKLAFVALTFDATSVLYVAEPRSIFVKLALVALTLEEMILVELRVAVLSMLKLALVELVLDAIEVVKLPLVPYTRPLVIPDKFCVEREDTFIILDLTVVE